MYANVWALLLNLHIKGAVLQFYLSRSVYSLYKQHSAQVNIMFKVSCGSVKSRSKNNTCDVTVMSSLGFTTDVVFIKQWSVIESQSPELTSGLDP